MIYSYKKMYNKNYLVLNQFDETLLINDYKLEMLRRNSINGLLDVQLFIEDNLPSFYYDITSKQSFYSLFYDCKLKKCDIIALFNSLHNIILNLNKYLLDLNHLVLIPQCIFHNKDTDSYSFCYCPNHTEDFFDAIKNLMSYLLTITDHDDENTVLISYALWQETQNDNFNIKSLMDIIEKFSEAKKITDIDTPILEEPAEVINTNILKEPDILLKENYTYQSPFIIKHATIYIVATVVLIVNIAMKILSFYSNELFFIILIGIIVFCIFHTSNMLRDAPLYRVYDKPSDNNNSTVIHINTDINVPQEVAESNETVLLCINPKLQNKRIIYSGIDFSQDVEISSFPFTIGKSDNNNLVIKNPSISRSHARIISNNNGYYIEDLNSSNGTKVNDSSIAAYTLTEISSGDTITFSNLTYIFQ